MEDQNEKQNKKKQRRFSARSYKNKINKAVETSDNEQKTQNRNILFGTFLFVVLITLMYFAFFPAPVYETLIDSAYHSNSITDIDMSILNDENIVSAEHKAAIEKTQHIYENRRDEIIDMLITSPITDAAIAKAQARIDAGEYGETAVFGGYSWYIPESEEINDIILSESEADEVLYLFSCLYDLDIITSNPGFYDIWLNGSDDLPVVGYTINAFGVDYTFPAKGGYYLEKDKLEEAKSKAYEDAVKATGAEILKKDTLLTKAFNFLTSPFRTKAYAEQWAETTFVNAYMNSYAEYCAANGGSAFIDTVIYTGVSDQLQSSIMFSLIGDPAPIWEGGATSYEGSIEDYDKDGYAQAIVAGFVANPLSGRLQIDVTTEKEDGIGPEDQGGTYIVQEWKSVPERYPLYTDDGQPVLDGNGDQVYETHTIKKLVDVEKSPEWYQYRDRCIYNISIKAYQCQEMVDFIFMASINGSGIPDALDQLIKGTYGDKGSEDWRKYKPTGSYKAWCAAYVDYWMHEIGVDFFTDELGCAYLKSFLGGTKGEPMKDYYGNPLSTGDVRQGLPNYPINEMTCFGGNGYTPQAGDIVFVVKPDGEIAHVGVVVDSSDYSVTISDGNNNDRAVWGEYTVDTADLWMNGIIYPAHELISDDIRDLVETSSEGGNEQ